MSVWPVHPILSARPDELGLTDGDRVELPEPDSPLHLGWLDEAAASRGARPQAVPLRDAARLEAELRARVGQQRPLRTVGIFGPAGSGRTSVLLGLAAALRAQRKRVAVLDADLAAPSLRRRLHCDAAALVVGGLVLPYAVDGLRLQGLDAFLPGPLPWRGAELRRVLERFREDVLWAGPDVLLIDMPPLGDERLLDVAAFFGGTLIRVAGPFDTAVTGPKASYTVRNAATGAADAALPYVAEGDLSETFSTRLRDLASELGAKGSGSVS